jgi:hypothetical protein
MLTFRCVFFLLCSNIAWSLAAYAQDVHVHDLFHQIDMHDIYSPPRDTIAKYKMRELQIDVLDSESGEKKLGYVYVFDRKNRITLLEKNERGARNHTIRKTFSYNKKNFITASAVVEISATDSFRVDYTYSKRRVGRGIVRWYRTSLFSEDTGSIDSVTCAMDHRGRIVMTEEYWSKDPQKRIYAYSQRGDSSILKTTALHMRSYYFSGDFYDQEIEQYDVRNAQGQLTDIVFKYIRYHTDCGVGLPMHESWRYDASGRVVSHVVIEGGNQFATKFVYSDVDHYCMYHLQFPTHDAPIDEGEGLVYCVAQDSSNKQKKLFYAGWQEEVIWHWK